MTQKGSWLRGFYSLSRNTHYPPPPSPPLRTLPRRRGPRLGIVSLRLGRRFGRFRRGFPAERLVAIPDDAQSVEGQKFVDILDEARCGADQRSQTAGRNHARLLSEFIDQALENAIDEPELAIIKTGLQTAHGRRTDHPRGLANLHARQARGALKERVG